MFELHNLGWHSFQQLCHSVLREILGQTVQTFLDTNDGGRDGAFAGVWENRGREKIEGQFVVQCKFTKRPGYSLKLADLKDEFQKVERLVAAGRCDCYILMTNAGITGSMETKLVAALKKLGVAQTLVYGSTWIEQQIRENKDLRMMVPRVYGLGDLSQIIDERAYSQATAVLESMRDDLAKVVVTSSYTKAAKALDTHKFVLIIGEAAAGKTTIASLLAMASADKWGALVVKADGPQAVLDHWNPKEAAQLFWIDDAFGVTQYESSQVRSWNHILPQMKTILLRGSRIVMTSRDYIYRRARYDLKEGAFPLFVESQTVVDVHDLASTEREQILYNHMKRGTQPAPFRTAIKELLPGVAAHQRFIPEIARRLADPFFTKQLLLSSWSLDRFVTQRESILVDVCKGLDPDCQAALALVYMRRSRLQSPISLGGPEKEAIERLGSNLGACSAALESLNGSMIVNAMVDGEAYWSFRHPTIGDAFATLLRGNRELLGIYVRGADVDKLITQITCGDTQIEHAVILPRSLFELVTERLQTYEHSASFKSDHLSTWHAGRKIRNFLATRCCKEFLQAYVLADPSILESITRPTRLLEFSEDVDLAIRLHEEGLLPEEFRRAFASAVSECAIEGEDARAITDPRLHALLNEREVSRLRHGIRTVLLPKIEAIRLNHQERVSLDLDAGWYMRRFDGILSAIKVQFPDSKRIGMTVTRSRQRAQEWVEKKAPLVDEGFRTLAAELSQAVPASSRSIFEDVDE